MSYLFAVTVFLLLIAILGISFPFFLQWLAEEDIFFATVKEGTVKAIVRGIRGDSSFSRLIMSFANYHLNDPTSEWYSDAFPDWEVLYHGKGNENGFKEDDAYYDDRSWLLKHLGLYWVGWPWAESVYIYQFEWNETYTNKDGSEKVLPRAEATDFIYVADFTYAIVTEGAETQDRLPTDELTLITVAVRNPYRALFSGEDWMRRITAAINRHARNFVGNKTYMELIGKDAGETGSETGVTNDRTDFSAPIIKLNTLLPDDDPKDPRCGLLGRYGVEIRTADLQTVELSGDGRQRHQEAATKAYVAKQDAEAERTVGQAKADVIEMIGEKEASALRKRLEVIKEHGEAGILLAGYDAIQESSKGPGSTVVWANNPLTVLAGMLKQETNGKGGNES